MNNTATNYTPLESLFLFQLLSKYGFLGDSFNRISDELKSTPLIREQDNYDHSRLSPGALQELALRLLREEQIQDAEATDRNQNGSSPNSKKRKLPSPPLPSLKEAHEQPEKLPGLVNKLYARFRENIVKEIREDEQRIEAIQRDIREIEKGEWDVRLAEERRTNAAKNGTPAPSEPRPVKPNGQVAPPPTVVPNPTPVQPTVPHKIPDTGKRVVPTPTPPPPPQTQPQPPHHPRPVPHPHHQSQAHPPHQPQGQPQQQSQSQPQPQPPLERRVFQPSPSPVPPNVRAPSEIRQATPDTKPKEPIRPPNGAAPVLQHPQVAQGYSPRPTSTTPQPPGTQGLQRPESLPKGRSPVPVPQAQPGQPHTPALKWEPPYQPHQHTPHQTPVPSPRQPYTSGNTRPPVYSPHVPPSAGHPQHPSNFTGGRQPTGQYTQQHRYPVQGAGPSSPSVLLPPQNAGQIPPSLQSLPVNATPDGAGQHVPPRRPPSVPAASSPSPIVPPNTYAHHPVQGSQAQTPVRPPSGLSNAHPQGAVPKAATPATHRSQPPISARPQHPQQHQPQHISHPVTPSQTQQLHGALKSHTTPYSQQGQSTSATKPVQAQRPHIPPISTPVPQPQSARPPSVSLAQTPLAVNVSPHVIRGHGTKWTSTPTPATPRMEDMSGYFDAQSPAFEPISPPVKPAQLSKTSPDQSAKKDVRKSLQKLDTTKSRGRPPRSAQKATSSLPIEETPADADSSHPIKNEEATPKAIEEISRQDGDDSSHVHAQLETVGAGQKRKRQDSPPNREPPTPATHVEWTRAFHKISTTALDQIIGHRHANMFATPIKARQAPGYYDVVIRPQDLKAIQKAISAGSKAASAAVATMPDVDANSPAIWLPMSVDLVPPRGIINIAQLERELVHMFANAIMYNPDTQRGLGPSFSRHYYGGSAEDGEYMHGYEIDENGVVKDTRNMFQEVEKLLGDLRNEVVPRAHAPGGSRSMSAVAGGEASTAEDDGDEQGNEAKRRRMRG
ncbi:hypothetical protein F5Y15DRAFT_368406 [Xylariaceae sp. FL0016]|nr:hypothetical protein F5Y15DRAFT_368406 [Xylariaceae sp. FL0016]